MKKSTFFQNAVKTLALPVILYTIFALISICTGNPFFTSNMFVFLLKQSCVVCCIAAAVGFHIFSGGVNLALGAIVYLSCILGGNIAVKNGYGAGVMAVLIISFAIALSLLEGILYVTLRLTPMINSLVFLMVCEAVTQILNNGKGLNVLTKPAYTIFYQSPYVFMIAAAVLVIYWAVLKYTRFGFNDRALANGQKIAVSFGVEEKKNVLMRYAIVGLFLGAAGLIHIGQNYQVPAAQNMETTILVFSALLPNMVAMTLSRYSNRSIAIVAAVFSMQTISVGFVCMHMDSNLAIVISGVFVLLFILYTMNLPAIQTHFQRKKMAEIFKKEFAEMAVK